MAFIGKEYIYEKQENFDGFLKAAGLPDEQIAKWLEHKPSSKLVKDGDKYTYISTDPSGTKEAHFTNGVEFDDKIQDKIPIKNKYVVEGNKVTQTITAEGKGSATFVREYDGDDLVVTITGTNFNGVAKRWYKA